MSRPTLEIRDLTGGYGSREVLHDVSLAAPSGTVVSLLGANGAGKTSLLRAIVGRQVAKRSGSILLEGHDVTHAPVIDNVRRGVSYVPEGGRVFPELSVEENLRLGAYTVSDAGAVRERRDRAFELFPILRERRSQHANLLSGGERQMLALGRALMADPKLLLLDEPSMGLAPQLIAQIFSIIREINQQGTTVLLVEQNAAQALKIARSRWRRARTAPGRS
jgi:branched-chain amino acid transport system ATP-binding protein